MREVFMISLNGNAYHVEQGGYEALRAYLQAAQTKLAEDPDRTEILADLEQAIAEKCQRHLGPSKGVVTAEEMQQILNEMGPVDGEPGPAAGQGAGARPDAAAAGAAPGERRLYQIREGSIVSGVCMGIAAYLGVDVTIVRLVFIGLTVLTGGGWILAYVVMMIVIPYASTSEEHAAAHGQSFSAVNLIDAFRRQHEGVRWQRQWRRQVKSQARAWRRETRRGRQQMKDQLRWGAPPPPYPDESGYGARMILGALAPITALLHVFLSIAFVLAIVQLVTRGQILGWVPPADIPVWVDIVVLAVLFSVLSEPLRATRRAYYMYGGGAGAWMALWGLIVWLAFMAVLFWSAYHYWPELHRIIEDIVDAVRSHPAHPVQQILSRS